MTVADPARYGEAAGSTRSAGWWRWLIVSAYLAFIFFLSAQSTLPALPGEPSDKLEHATAYSVLGALVVWAAVRGDWRRVTWRTVVGVTVFCVLYGWSDEIHQRFVPGRHYDLRDLLADGTGAFLAAAASWAWGIIARGRRQTHDM